MASKHPHFADLRRMTLEISHFCDEHHRTPIACDTMSQVMFRRCTHPGDPSSHWPTPPATQGCVDQSRWRRSRPCGNLAQINLSIGIDASGDGRERRCERPSAKSGVFGRELGAGTDWSPRTYTSQRGRFPVAADWTRLPNGSLARKGAGLRCTCQRWWARLDSNQRPRDYESPALTN